MLLSCQFGCPLHPRCGIAGTLNFMNGSYTAVEFMKITAKASTSMTGNDLAKMYEFSYGAINRNLQDLTHQDSLVQPNGGGNCLNWVLGHVIVSRNLVLMLAGATPVLTGEHVAGYQRGSHPEGTEKFLDLATLRGFLDDSQKQLIPALAALSDDALNRAVPEQYRRPPLTGSLGDALIRLHYHEGYHNGQIGLLRRLAGKEGAIK